MATQGRKRPGGRPQPQGGGILSQRTPRIKIADSGYHQAIETEARVKVSQKKKIILQQDEGNEGETNIKENSKRSRFKNKQIPEKMELLTKNSKRNKNEKFQRLSKRTSNAGRLQHPRSRIPGKEIPKGYGSIRERD